MDYNRFHAEVAMELPGDGFSANHIPLKTKSYGDYEFVRFGEFEGGLDFEKCASERAACISQAKRGWGAGFPHNLGNADFTKAIAKFRANIDLYWELSHDQIFSKEEIYIRCLEEGPEFTEYIKKSRANCLRSITAETGTDLEEDYSTWGYKGYNSIIHERYLMHWDDRKDVDDVKFCFMPTKETNLVLFRTMFRNYLLFCGVSQEDFAQDFDMHSQLRNTVMWDTSKKTKATALMREFWKEDVDTSGPYIGKRTVVLTEPGHTRDTCIGDPSTILKVKMLNKLSRVISEKSPYSANAPTAVANERYKRVLQRHGFVHLDFKKYGLTFPRALMNEAIKIIGEFANIDVSDLIIDDFYVDIDGETYATARGTSLGWLDSLNAHCVSAILHDLSVTNGLDFDHVIFNDDVEISTWKDKDLRGRLEIIRTVVLLTCDDFDIPCSLSKTYGSLASIFLERYTYFDRHYDLDMYKEQLTVDAFAKSLVTEYPWRAKMLFATAYQWTKSAYARNRCIDSCPREFEGLPNEQDVPLYSGGWYITTSKGLDQVLRMSGWIHLALGKEIQKWSPPKYATPVKKVSPTAKIAEASSRKAHFASSAGLARQVFGDPGNLDDINVEASIGADSLEQLLAYYMGGAEQWHQRIVSLKIQRFSGKQPPPDSSGSDSSAGSSTG
jgi:hypothetical protein